MKLDSADRNFSYWIRFLDGWKCSRCGKKFEVKSQGLHCSHYWGRAKENTRFDPDNATSLCFGCHHVWGHGDGRDEYKQFMIDELGQRRFDLLNLRAHTAGKKDRKMAALYWKTKLKRDYGYQL